VGATTNILGEILGPDLLVIICLVALLFGGSQVPKLARSIGSARREFEKGLAGDTADRPEPKTTAATTSPSVLSKAEVEQLLRNGDATPTDDTGHQPPPAPA
jgi:sec-independent protein translocase protein TatA